jgi:peptide deformylase
MKKPLCYYGNPILRKKCLPVKKITDEIRQIVQDMIDTMDSLKGVGLAANQVGILYQIFVIRPLLKSDQQDPQFGPVEVYINPELTNPSEQTEILMEGCLSFPHLHIDIERPYKIHVKALDLSGNVIEEDAMGYKARELMHENDHLHGRFFIDRITDPQTKEYIKPLLKEIQKKYSKK